MRLRALLASVLLVAAPSAALAGPAKPAVPIPPSPRNEPLYQMAVPAKVTLIAWLPVDKQPDMVDVDVRIEVVVPYSCGDRLAGVMRAGGAKLDGPDTWDVLIEHRPDPECKPEPTRMANRYTVRMKLPVGQKRDLTIGPTVMTVARTAQQVTLNGVAPEGDAPGAPPTAKPITLVLGESPSAKLVASDRDGNDVDSARTVMTVTGRFPGCALTPIGLVARGDASTRFALTRYVPIAPVLLDRPCKEKPAVVTRELSTLVRLPKGKNETKITVGASSIDVKVGPRPQNAPQPAPAPAMTPVPTGGRDTTHGPIH